MTPTLRPTSTPLLSKARVASLIALLSTGLLPLTGCLVVGASSSGGFFIWPGSIGLLLVILVVVLLLRRR